MPELYHKHDDVGLHVLKHESTDVTMTMMVAELKSNPWLAHSEFYSYHQTARLRAAVLELLSDPKI